MEEFRRAMESKDIERLMTLFAEDVVFRSPVVYAPYQGRAIIEPLLRAAAEVFEDVRYTRRIGAADAADHALVLQARVGEREVEACDFLHVNDEGLIDELYVMVRPLSAAMAVSAAIRDQLTSAQSASAA